MTLFNFITQNKQKVSDLIDALVEEKIFVLNAEDFDFTRDDITTDFEEGTLTFTVEIDNDITLSTTVDMFDINDNIDHLKKIQDPDLRESVITALEDHFLGEIKDTIENAESTLEEAKNEHQNLLRSETEIKASLRAVKDEWGII